MKLIKRLIAVVFIITLLSASAGCYMISAQKMRRVKGTYKLTHYTYTPQHERKEGYTPKTTNYVEDEAYRYEDYLVVTGEGRGYYVHKSATEPAYVKEITLSYEYNSEDSSKVDYVIYNDSVTVNSDSGTNRLGVTKNNLGYSKPAFDYTELFTKRPMRSEYISVHWERVSSDTDLSFVEKELGALKYYEYNAFSVRGVYQRSASWNIESGEVQNDPYQYYYYVIDPVKNALKATVYYALKETPTQQVKQELTLERLAEDWSSISLGGDTWAKEPWASSYTNDNEGLRSTLNFTSSDISEENIQALIASWLPVEE